MKTKCPIKDPTPSPNAVVRLKNMLTENESTIIFSIIRNSLVSLADSVSKLMIWCLRVQSPGSARHPFIEIGHEILCTASLLLIEVGQMSVTRERMCT